MDTVLSIFIDIAVGALFCGGLTWLGDKQAEKNKKTAENESSEFKV
jgi:hypothetical protein